MRQTRHSKHQRVKVFISHSNVDMVFARHVRNLLFQRLNAQVFTTEELSAGENGNLSSGMSCPPLMWWWRC